VQNEHKPCRSVGLDSSSRQCVINRTRRNNVYNVVSQWCRERREAQPSISYTLLVYLGVTQSEFF